MRDDLLRRLDIGAKLASRRANEVTKFHNLMRASREYTLALSVGTIPGTGPEWTEVCRAAFEAFGCDELHDMWTEAAPPSPDDIDLFGNPVLSLRSRIASAQFDEGKSL